LKIVFHPNYCNTYSSDPAAAPGRMEAILEELKGLEFIKPVQATVDDLALVHRLSQNNAPNI